MANNILEVKHFKKAVDGSTEGNSYGREWSNLVREYLNTGYTNESTQHDITVSGKLYHALKRGEVTAFYDESGNTLFDVENERLAEEYAWMIKVSESGENESERSGEDQEPAESNAAEETSDETATEIESATNPVEDHQETPTVVEESAETTAVSPEAAKEKLNQELKEAKDKAFAEPVIEYLLKRIDESPSLAADICQKHKTWGKCYSYIYQKAAKQATNQRAAVRDDVVYEWAEDYYHKDDKAEEEKRAKEAADRKAKSSKDQEKLEKRNKAAQKKAAEKKKTDIKTPKAEKQEAPKTEAKQKEESSQVHAKKGQKKSNDMEGQMDLFSMMGM